MFAPLDRPEQSGELSISLSTMIDSEQKARRKFALHLRTARGPGRNFHSPRQTSWSYLSHSKFWSEEPQPILAGFHSSSPDLLITRDENFASTGKLGYSAAGPPKGTL